MKKIDFLLFQEVVDLTGIPARTLVNMEHRGDFPRRWPSRGVGKKRWRKAVVEEWLDSMGYEEKNNMGHMAKRFKAVPPGVEILRARDGTGMKEYAFLAPKGLVLRCEGTVHHTLYDNRIPRMSLEQCEYYPRCHQCNFTNDYLYTFYKKIRRDK